MPKFLTYKRPTAAPRQNWNNAPDRQAAAPRKAPDETRAAPDKMELPQLSPLVLQQLLRKSQG